MNYMNKEGNYKGFEMQEETLKERFDKAFYALLDAGERLQELCQKLEYAGKLIQLNKVKQKQVKELLNNDN